MVANTGFLMVEGGTPTMCLSCICYFSWNKKVLLHERKRHIACRVASARFADQSPDGGGGGTPSSLGQGVPHPVLDGGYPIQSWTGGTPSSPGWGVPQYPHADLGWEYLISRMGYPPVQSWDGISPIQAWDGVPPVSRWGTPTWDGVTPHHQDGVPPI